MPRSVQGEDMSSDWAQILEWKPHWVSLPERIQEYAKLTGTDPHKVVSLKFRPVEGMPDEQPDFSKIYRFNSYLLAEYEDVFKEAPELERRGLLSVLEVPGTEPPIIGIEHETGLEIVCAVFAGLAAVDSVIAIWEKIRKVIDKYRPSSVEDLRIELRHLDPQGNLLQELIVTKPVGSPVDLNEVASLVSARLSKLDTEPPT
jgi:hypothetical protein